MGKYYPIMLDIHNKKCTVIGGGGVAQRKVLSLLECGANVTVISPKVMDELRKLQQENRITIKNRPYKYGDLKDNYLVYVATDDPHINMECVKECREEEILINVVDQPKFCDFIVPASIQRGDLTITISTNGKSPMLSHRLREELEETFGAEYEEFLNHLGELRGIVIEKVEDIHIRKKIFKEIVYSDLLNRYKNGEVEDLREEMQRIYKNGIKDSLIDKY